MSQLSNVTEVGDLDIENTGITTLAPLSHLTTATGFVQIADDAALPSLASASALTSLAGVSGLQSVGGDLVLEDVPSLVDLSGVGALTSVGGSLRVIGATTRGSPFAKRPRCPSSSGRRARA